MRKPDKKTHFTGKPMALDRTSTKDRLEAAAIGCRYRASPYHCPDDKGKVAVRTKPQSICPREWTTRQAMNAIREAIKRGHISASWTSDGRYPRHVWHKEGDIWYHAMTGNGDDGVYHGYQEISR